MCTRKIRKYFKKERKDIDGCMSKETKARRENSKWPYLKEFEQKNKVVLDYNNTLYKIALAGVAQWIRWQTARQRVAGSIPSQGTCLGCKLDLQ